MLFQLSNTAQGRDFYRSHDWLVLGFMLADRLTYFVGSVVQVLVGL